MPKNLGVDTFPDPVNHFKFFFFSVATFSHRRSAGIEKPGGRHLSGLCRPFRGPLAAILDFEGGVALQVVSECTRRRAASLAFNHLIIKHFYMVFEIARISSMLSVYVYHTIN